METREYVHETNVRHPRQKGCRTHEVRGDPCTAHSQEMQNVSQGRNLSIQGDLDVRNRAMCMPKDILFVFEKPTVSQTFQGLSHA